MSKEINALLGKAFSGDGASWRVSDLYQSCYDALILAIRSGEDFDTGWWGVKKEIQGGRIRREGSTITCEASVSNDFDEEGKGKSTFTVPKIIHPTRLMGRISGCLNDALSAAKEDQREYALVAGFTIFRNGIEAGTYLAPIGEGHSYKRPPGDYYSHWGFLAGSVAVKQPIPEEVLRQISTFCEDPEPEDAEYEFGRAVKKFKHGDVEYKVMTWGTD